jgi:hypothetical protein
MRNRIINGAMTIDQRNNGAAVTNSGGVSVYAVDRFAADNATDAVYTVQQVTDAPSGFINSAKVTVTTADASIGASQISSFFQAIEGYNLADLAWGTVSAQTVTMSFWVKSSLTGTFGGALRGAASTRSYPFTYTISAANTWEQKVITIVGETTGTWNNTNGTGVQVMFGLAVGSTFSGTPGAWASASLRSATGATNILSTLGATWQITGVQLEKGSVATPFEFRSIGTELGLCERYFETQSGYNTLIYSDNAVANGTVPFTFAVVKRANPTIVLTNPSSTLSNTGTQSAVSISAARFEINVTSSSGAGIRGGFNNNGSFTASAEL